MIANLQMTELNGAEDELLPRDKGPVRALVDLI
jgi:hypothetical protein